MLLSIPGSTYQSPFAILTPSTGAQAAANASSTSGASSAAASDAAASSTLSPADFMDLLVAQMKNQDPTNPMDPTTFVSQLVQFNTLENVISINQELAPPTTSTTSSSAGASSGSANATAPIQADSFFPTSDTSSTNADSTFFQEA